MRNVVGWFAALLGAVCALLLALPGTASACEVRYAAASAASGCGDSTKIVVVSASVAGGGLAIAAVRQVLRATSMSFQQIAATDYRVLGQLMGDLEADTGEQLQAVEEAEVDELDQAIDDAANEVANVVAFNQTLATSQTSVPTMQPLTYGPLDPISALALGLSLAGNLWAYRWDILVRTNVMYYKLKGLFTDYRG